MSCTAGKWGYFEKKPDVFPPGESGVKSGSYLFCRHRRREEILPLAPTSPKITLLSFPGEKVRTASAIRSLSAPTRTFHPFYPVLGPTDPTGYPIRTADASRPGESDRGKCRDFPSPFILFTYNSLVVTRSTLEPGAGI